MMVGLVYLGLELGGWMGKVGLGVHGPLGDLEIGEVLERGGDRVDLRLMSVVVRGKMC